MLPCENLCLFCRGLEFDAERLASKGGVAIVKKIPPGRCMLPLGQFNFELRKVKQKEVTLSPRRTDNIFLQQDFC